MNIAVLLAGHLRFWKLCKENFIENIYSTNHQIDVFVDTYNVKYRSDYSVNGENEAENALLSENSIRAEFDKLNLVHLSVEPEVLYDPIFCRTPQARKLLRVYDAFIEYEKKHEIKYDLVIKSRFDIVLHKKLDYNHLISEYSKNNNVIHISKGVVNCRPEHNDLFAISDRKTFDFYANRHREYSDVICPHTTIDLMSKNSGVVCIPYIPVSIYRFDKLRNPVLEH